MEQARKGLKEAKRWPRWWFWWGIGRALSIWKHYILDRVKYMWVLLPSIPKEETGSGFSVQALGQKICSGRALGVCGLRSRSRNQSWTQVFLSCHPKKFNMGTANFRSLSDQLAWSSPLYRTTKILILKHCNVLQYIFANGVDLDFFRYWHMPSAWQ